MPQGTFSPAVPLATSNPNEPDATFGRGSVGESFDSADASALLEAQNERRCSGAALLEAQMEKVKDSLLVTERHAKQLEDQLQKLQSLMAANNLNKSSSPVDVSKRPSASYQPFQALGSHPSSLPLSAYPNGVAQAKADALLADSSFSARAPASLSLTTRSWTGVATALPIQTRRALAATSRSARRALASFQSQSTASSSSCPAPVGTAAFSSRAPSSTAAVAAAAVAGARAAALAAAAKADSQSNYHIYGEPSHGYEHTPTLTSAPSLSALPPRSATSPVPPATPSPTLVALAAGAAIPASTVVPAHTQLGTWEWPSELPVQQGQAQSQQTRPAQQQPQQQQQHQSQPPQHAAWQHQAVQPQEQPFCTPVPNHEITQSSLTSMPERLPQSLERNFQVHAGSDLGEGSVAIVRRIRDRRDDRELALKVVEKQPLLIRNMAAQVQREVRLQGSFKHPNVVRLHDFIEDATHIYMILELAGCGSLLGLMQRHHGGRLPEAPAGWLFQQVVEGVSYLHGQGCIHRDLKPDNILLGDGHVPKVCDFGWCADVSEGTPRRTMCGTMDYMAPEVINSEGHDLPVDLWSLGVMLYELMSGHTPFVCGISTGSNEEFFEKVQRVEYPFPPWFSNEACHLVHCLLQRQPEHRWITSKVLKHPWIINFYDAPKQANRPPAIEPGSTSPGTSPDQEIPDTPVVHTPVLVQTNGVSGAGNISGALAKKEIPIAGPLSPSTVTSSAAAAATLLGISKSLSRQDLSAMGVSPVQPRAVAVTSNGNGGSAAQARVVVPRQQSPQADHASFAPSTSTASGAQAQRPRRAGDGVGATPANLANASNISSQVGATAAVPRSAGRGFFSKNGRTFNTAHLALAVSTAASPGSGVVSSYAPVASQGYPDSPSGNGGRVVGQGVVGMQGSAFSTALVAPPRSPRQFSAAGYAAPTSARYAHASGATSRVATMQAVVSSDIGTSGIGLGGGCGTWPTLRDPTPAALRPVPVMSQGGNGAKLAGSVQHGAAAAKLGNLHLGSVAPGVAMLGTSGSGTPLPPLQFSSQASPRQALPTRGPGHEG